VQVPGEEGEIEKEMPWERMSAHRKWRRTKDAGGERFRVGGAYLKGRGTEIQLMSTKTRKKVEGRASCNPELKAVKKRVPS